MGLDSPSLSLAGTKPRSAAPGTAGSRTAGIGNLFPQGTPGIVQPAQPPNPFPFLTSGSRIGSTPGSSVGPGVTDTAMTNYSTALQNAYNAFKGYSDPQQAALENQRKSIQGDLMGEGLNYAQQQRFAHEDYANQMARNGLSVESLGIDRAAAARAGINVDQLMALAGQMYQNRLGSTRLESDIHRRGQLSNATARGAMVTQGNRDALSDISKQLGFSEGQLGIGYQQDLVGLKEQKAQAADQNKQLDIKAKELGLQRNELLTALNQGLSRLGLNHIMDARSLMDKMTSNEVDQKALAESIYRQAIDYAGVFAANPALGQSTRRPTAQ